jgi:hypothetical protein
MTMRIRTFIAALVLGSAIVAAHGAMLIKIGRP